MEVTVTQFIRNFAHYREQAKETPVIVKSRSRVVGAFISADQYAQLRRASRQTYRVEDLPDDAVAAIRTATYPSEEELKALDL